jgi:RNA polymerase sigma factor FliA
MDVTVPISSESELWHRYIDTKDQDAHSELLRLYLPRARLIAAQIYRRLKIPELDWSDYVQNATYGLLESMQRYQPTRDIPFLVYSQPRIRGAVFNGLRTFISERKLQPNFKAWHYHERLESLSEQETQDNLHAFTSIVSNLAIGYLLDFSASNQHNEHQHEASRYAQEQQIEELIQIALTELTEKEQAVIKMHYFHQLPFNEIAQSLQVTKGRVSQLHRKALERLRSKLSQSGYQSTDF